MSIYSIDVWEKAQEAGKSLFDLLEEHPPPPIDETDMGTPPELQAKIERLRRKPANQAQGKGDASSPTRADGDTQGEGGGSASAPEVAPYPPPLTLEHIITQEPPEIKWIVPGLIPQGCIGLIQGLPSVGKSYLALYLAIAIANGTRLVSKTPTPGVSVRYIALEDGPEVVHWRASRVCETIKPKPTADFQAFCWQGIPIVVRANGGTTLSPQAQALVDDIRKTQKPTLLIIDHWTLACKGLKDENASTEVGDVLRVLLDVCKSSNCTIALIHHLSKANKERDPIYSSRGSSVLPASARFILCVNQPEEKEIAFLKEKADGTFIALDAVKVSFGKRPPRCYFRISPGGYIYPIATDIEAQKLHTIAEAVCECVTQTDLYFLLDDLLAKKAFKSALKSIGVSLRKKERIRGLLDEAVKQKLIGIEVDSEPGKRGPKAKKYGPIRGN